jgi:hypothetical protein
MHYCREHFVLMPLIDEPLSFVISSARVLPLSFSADMKARRGVVSQQFIK